MSRSSNARRPYVRQTKSITRRASKDLLNNAGLAPIERPRVEQLEPRKMLFSLSIDGTNIDGAGNFYDEAYFAYFVPYLQSPEEPGDGDDDENLEEDFSGEALGQIFPNTQRVMGGSDILIRNVNTQTLELVAPFDDNGNPIGEFTSLHVRTGIAGQQFFLATLTDPNAQNGIRDVYLNAQFSVNSAGAGLLNGAIEIQTIFQGQVQRTYTQADLAAQNGGNGNGVFNVNALGGEIGAFDEIRFIQTETVGTPGVTIADFNLDDFNYTPPSTVFEDIVDGRVFGAYVRITGDIGATATVLDLYGRDMRETIQLGKPSNDANFVYGDFTGDGIPEYNDGIGSVTVTGLGDGEGSSLYMTGGEIIAFGTSAPPPTAEFIENGFAWDFGTDYDFIDDLEGAGFGFFLLPDGERGASGLPPEQARLVIGAPAERALNNYNPGGVPVGFNGVFFDQDYAHNPEHGIFLLDGQSIGDVGLHSILFGSSQFDGSVGVLSTGVNYGLISVAGDLEAFVVASDSGAFSADPADGQTGNFNFTTNSQLLVGRTLREVAIGGKNLMSVIVDGDLNSPTTAPPNDVLLYTEREVVLGSDPSADNASYFFHRSMRDGVVSGGGFNLFNFPDQVSRDVGFIDFNFRNDTFLSAEFIGSASTSVVVEGSTGGQDFYSSTEDASDVFGFAVDGTRDIVIESVAALSASNANIRVLDAEGRTVAAMVASIESGFGNKLTYTPEGPGVYYLAIGHGTGTIDFGIDLGYSVLISGLAPTTLGSYRSAVGFGTGNDGRQVAADGELARPVVALNSGSAGSIRVGTGYVRSNGSGNDEVATGAINTLDTDDTVAQMGGFSFSAPGNLYNISTGGDIAANTLGAGAPNDFTVGRHFGSLYTGLSTALGTDYQQGDVGNFTLTTGGQIGLINISGAVGTDQDDGANNGALANLVTQPVVFKTGVDPDLQGHIGMIRIGSHVSGDTLTIDTSATNGSIVGGLLISQDAPNFGDDATYGDDLGIFDGFDGIDLQLGQDSDIRFVDTPFIDLQGASDAFLPIITGETLTLVDDAGGRVEISIDSRGPDGLELGRVFIVPVEGSEGVAIARIEIDSLVGTGQITGGSTLNIRGESGQSVNDIISIGRIVILNSDAFSEIQITGTAQIDVLRIDAPVGLGVINQDTPDGDIVAIDTQTLTTLQIQQGDLGRTQVLEWGPSKIGPELGINDNNNNQNALNLDANLIDPDWGGEIFRQTSNSIVVAGGAFLDDVGSPFDVFLNGIVIRQGGITDVIEVSGAIGDVISEDAAADINLIRANEDRMTADGEFDGLIGTIFSARDIATVEIGDGLTGAGTSPFAEAGIFAGGSIGRVIDNVSGANIEGVIAAAGVQAGGVVGLASGAGINEIELDTGGSIRDAFISTPRFLDEFWESIHYGNFRVFVGVLNEINLNGGNIFRSTIITSTLNNIDIRGGFFDATELTVINSVTNRISADGFRNTTTGGDPLEFRLSRILVGEDLERLNVTNNGDFVDTVLQVTGNIERSLTARNIIRGNIGVANIIESINLTGSMLASTLTAGQLVAFTAADSLRTSTVSISGPLENLTVGNEISRTDITVSGPNGRVDLINAMNTIDANITSSGPIAEISSTTADIRGSVRTTTAAGDIEMISAARDLSITTDIGGDVDMLVAGRNIGDADNPSVILVRGDVGIFDVSGGRLFSDLRVGSTIESVLLGSTPNLPQSNKGADGTIEAFGRIQSVLVTGDYDGSILSESGGIGNVTITDGSLLREASIIARDGGIGSVVIVAGHLLGNIFAEQTIGTIRVVASSDGVFGDVGINPNLSAGVASGDSNRNQLPPGVVATNAIDGPTIASLRGINNFIVTGGSIYDATIYAGTNLGLLQVFGNIQSDGQQGDDDSVTIAAGDQIQQVTVTGGVTDTLFLAGLETFGSMSISDIGSSLYTDRAGGIGADADVIKSGRIQNVSIGATASDVTFSAGMTAGNDGVYGTGDERHVVGFSFVDDLIIGGARTNVTVSADRKFYTLNGTTITPTIQNSDASLNNAGRNAANEGGLLESLTAAFSGPSVDLSNLGTVIDFGTTSTFAWNGTTFTVQATSTDGGANAEAARGIVWDAARGRLILANTRLADGVIVTILDNDSNPSTPLPDLIDFDIVSNDEASIGLIQINGNLRGGSDIIVDNYARTIDIDDYEGTGQIIVGVDVVTLTTGRFAGGSITANFVDALNINSSIVVFSGSVPSVDIAGARSISVAQNVTAIINIDRSVSGAFSVGGSFAQALVRAGGSIGSISADEITRSRISVANVIGSVNVVGDVFDTSIIAGGDLGSDAQIGAGGDSTTADRATSGTIGAVTIGGDFFESDLVAGYLRGSDGFFGTDDDTAASGISSIGNVTIGGTGVGSNVNSESYTIAAAGSLAFVTVGGTEAESVGNFAVDAFSGEPLPLQVTNLAVTQDARSYTAAFTFNQDLKTDTFIDALSIREVVSEGNFLTLTKPTAIPGSGDYSVEFDIPNRMVFVTVTRSVTDQDLIDNGDGTFSRPATAAAGVYRIELDSDILRSRVSQARLDGDGDGFATDGDDFSVDDIIGDAGDAASTRDPETVDVNSDGEILVDFFGAVSLDQVFDSNRTPDGVLDPNNPFVLRGAMGDHPDRDLNEFGFGGDIDVYSMTLQAGQILQLGEITGASFQAQRSVYFQPSDNSEPQLVFSQLGSSFNANIFLQTFGFETDQALPLPVQPAEATDRSDAAALLIKESGTFFIVLEAGSTPSNSWYTPGTVNNTEVQPNQIGNYAFTVEVFDDGNSGFAAGSDSGDGTNVVHAPPLSLFSDADDTVVIGDYTFNRDAGADGVFGNGDDFVTGSTADGELTSTRVGTRLTNTISSSLGDPGVTGLPGNVESDVDIWHLNNGQQIAPGTAMTITVKLAEVGGDLGSTITQNVERFSSLSDFSDLTKNVQFALFETTNSTGVDDANLIFSPTDFEAKAATPNTIIAENGATRYGFDANGDFFISFIMPPALGGAANDAGTYAVYLQGAFQSDYEIEIVTQGTGSQQVRSQNVLIETAGGVLDWLTVNGDPTEVGGFDASSLGFTGRVNNVNINTFILDELVTNLNDIFADAGLDVNFSTDPADFEFQEFSTVFLTSDHNPIGLIIRSDFGYAEHSDPFNTDREDEAVVFSPDLSTLGYAPTTADLDSFVESLTAATGRRVGELVGLRLTDTQGGFGAGDQDLFNASSVRLTPAGVFDDYVITDDARSIAGPLSFIDDTGFYLGQQSALSLLDRILAN